MLDFFQPPEAVTMENFNKRLRDIKASLPAQNLKIATGSYVGTGTGGKSNPNTLSFNFAPDFLVIQSDDDVTIAELRINKDCTYAGSQESGVDSGQTWGRNNSVTFSNNGKTISWYCNDYSRESENSYGQLNANGMIYHYFAIGT